jgi:hypothetical protein
LLDVDRTGGKCNAVLAFHRGRSWWDGPFITFDIIASRSRFRELVTNVRHGLVPENISIKLAEDEKFWRSVDPTSKWSRKIWQNEIDDTLDCAAIPIENYAFSYLIKKADRST